MRHKRDTYLNNEIADHSKNRQGEEALYAEQGRLQPRQFIYFNNDTRDCLIIAITKCMGDVENM
jgi:hypothetical protein